MTGDTEPTDDELVRRSILQPDSDAFTRLVQRHQSRLRLFLRGLCHQPDLADELAQETFIKAHRSLPSFKFQASFKTWLMSIGRNCWLDQTRLASYQKFTAIDKDENFIASHESNASTSVDDVSKHLEDQLIFSIDLHRAMLQLSRTEREVIAHCYFADLSMSETAALMTLPLGTVKTHAHRSLVKLKQLLSAWQNQSTIERLNT